MRLSVILVTSAEGHVLIDAALPESAAAVASSVRALGFKVEDIRLIVNSHVHFDHAGAIAELQRVSAATVAATRAPILSTLTDSRRCRQMDFSLPAAATIRMR